MVRRNKMCIQTIITINLSTATKYIFGHFSCGKSFITLVKVVIMTAADMVTYREEVFYNQCALALLYVTNWDPKNWIKNKFHC